MLTNLPFKRLVFTVSACAVLVACQTTPETRAAQEAGPLESVALTVERDGNHASAAQQYLRLFELEDDNPSLLIGAARNLRYDGRAIEGVRILQRRYEAFEDDPPFRLELAKNKIAAGKNASAIDDLIAAAGGDGENWEIYSALGIAYDMTENFTAAHDAYLKAIALSDSDPTTLNNYAISLALSGDVEGAIAFLKDQPRAIRRSPHIRQNLAMFMAIQGDIETAGELARMDLDEDQVSRNLEFFEQFQD